MAERAVKVDKAIDLAANKLGFAAFKSHQTSALRQFVNGNDLFVSLPTGFGKSGIFQAAPVVLDLLNDADEDGNQKALVIVILPLKALAVDQLQRVSQLGLNAADITSSNIPDTILEENDKYSILYASPESLFTTKGKELLHLVRPRCSGIFVDESHCVVQWGHSSGQTSAFRKAYSQIGELRSVLRSSTCMVALTATATLKVRQAITSSLAMRNFELIEESPERTNVKYTVVKSPSKDLDHMFSWLATNIAEKGALADRTIVYCQSRQRVGKLYSLFCSLLSTELYCHFDMYHTNTENDVQKRIVSSFSNKDGNVRLLFATIAFGLGVDVQGVHTVVILGHPSDLDDVMQLSGRAGRDGVASVSILIDFPGAGAGFKTSDAMKEYLKGDKCRREVVRESFPADRKHSIASHNCCDICARSCTCQEGKCTIPVPDAENQFRTILTHGASKSSELAMVSVSETEVNQVKQQLDELRASLLVDSNSHLYTGEDMTSGLSVSTMEEIVMECNIVFPFEVFQDRYMFSRREIALTAWSIVKTCVSNYTDTSITESELDSNLDSSTCSVSDEDVFSGEYAEVQVGYSSESD